MTNLLPLPAQKSLWGIHSARFILILSLVMIALAVIALLALSPSFVALEVNTLSEEEMAAQGSNAAESQKSMAKSQLLLSAISPLIYSTSSPSAAIEKALSLRPKGALVQRVRYVSSSKSIQLSGTANREALTAYRAALEAEGTFTSVAVPVAALVSSNGQFSITLGGNF